MQQPTLWRFYRQAPARTRLVLWGVGGAAVFVLWAGVSTVNFLLTHVGPGQADPAREQASVEEIPQALPPFEVTFQIKRMNIPLTNRSGNQVAYAQFDLVFDCPLAECVDQMNLYRARIRDAVYSAASGLRVDHFQDENAVAGFESFKKKILTQVRGFVPVAPPRDLVISNWVMQ